MSEQILRSVHPALISTSGINTNVSSLKDFFDLTRPEYKDSTGQFNSFASGLTAINASLLEIALPPIKGGGGFASFDIVADRTTGGGTAYFQLEVLIGSTGYRSDIVITGAPSGQRMKINGHAGVNSIGGGSSQVASVDGACSVCYGSSIDTQGISIDPPDNDMNGAGRLLRIRYALNSGLGTTLRVYSAALRYCP